MKAASAGRDRAGALAALHAQAFETGWSEDEIAGLLGAPGGAAFEVEGGFILLRVLPEEAEVLTLAVAPEARRRGAGRALVRAGVAAAEAAGAEVVFLEVAADNTAARALYGGEGFEEVGRRKSYYARPGGAVDAVVLRRALNSGSR